MRLTNVGASFELGVDKSSMDGGFIEFVSATLEQAVSVMRPFAGISLREGTARYVQTATPSELVGLNGGNTVPFVVTCPGDDVVTPVFKVGVRIHRVDGSSIEQEYAFELIASCGEQLPLSWKKVYRLVLSVIPGPNTALGAGIGTMFLSFGNAFMFGGLLWMIPDEDQFSAFESALQQPSEEGITKRRIR